MIIALRGLKVEVIGQGQGHGQANAVGLTSIEGSFSSLVIYRVTCFHPLELTPCCRPTSLSPIMLHG